MRYFFSLKFIAYLYYKMINILIFRFQQDTNDENSNKEEARFLNNLAFFVPNLEKT